MKFGLIRGKTSSSLLLVFHSLFSLNSFPTVHVRLYMTAGEFGTSAVWGNLLFLGRELQFVGSHLVILFCSAFNDEFSFLLQSRLGAANNCPVLLFSIVSRIF
ncbi:hypothetical protein O6P43_030711 [Quillaja saponaria]|uniref:Uncharacterized protein n=1 Tax=Quillaja saponaria TaxID=32244 RepID=A0AAD7P7Y9_QUISA|nr:hypothetical protein O6P43_030711 [Quillaja saponaria]